MEHTPVELQQRLAAALQRSTARVFIRRVGAFYQTADWLKLRADHAAARDAVYSNISDPHAIIGPNGIVLSTKARTKAEFLMRPDHGRVLSASSIELLKPYRGFAPDVQLVVGDGLSAQAVIDHAFTVLNGITAGCSQRGWRLGPTLLIHHCRVGVMNMLGELLQPNMVVLLIGERPGLATASSMSAYLAFQPKDGHTDANRNLISNIHQQGVLPTAAPERILAMMDQLWQHRTSGVAIKETLQADRIAQIPASSE